jgi:hypothetical protein
MFLLLDIRDQWGSFWADLPLVYFKFSSGLGHSGDGPDQIFLLFLILIFATAHIIKQK